MGRVIMAGIKVLEIRITTKLPVKDVAFIFRDNIVKADKRFFRMLESQNKLQWEFRTPEKPTDAFDSLREPAGPEPAFQQAVAASNELEFFLKVWDHGTDRHVMVGTGDSQLARSYVGNFMNHLKGADPSIQVRETPNVV
jgi:hypothetical protein